MSPCSSFIGKTLPLRGAESTRDGAILSFFQDADTTDAPWKRQDFSQQRFSFDDRGKQRIYARASDLRCHQPGFFFRRQMHFLSIAAFDPPEGGKDGKPK